MTNLEIQLNKISSYADYYLSILRQFPEGVWIEPSNKEDEAFGVCDILVDKYLMIQRIAPIGVNGSLKGTRVAFLYKEDLNYQDLNTF